MKGPEVKAFKAESSIVPKIRRLEIPLAIYITEKEAVHAFDRLEVVYKALVQVAEKFSFPGIKMAVLEPENPTSKVKKFEVVSEYSLKDRMRVSLEAVVFATFEEDQDFWKKGRAISAVVDALESFCQKQNREKGCIV